MGGGIFLIQDGGGLVEMNEQPYGSEAMLQELLAKYPNLLAGDQMDAEDPRRWILVSREMGVPCTEDGGDRWSLDHLFLDQDAIPTLIEVKRSSDTRIRREVVGQMLDYAANAVVYWPIDSIRARFEETCRKAGTSPEAAIQGLIGAEKAIEDFWLQLKTNLQARRIRMVFVADVIPPELRRIVEFLNDLMDPAEVFAIEIRQFVGPNVKSLIPRVIGATAEAERKKGGPARAEKRKWDESSFFATLRERRGENEVVIARSVFDWAAKHRLRIWWGEGSKDGSFFPMLDLGGVGYSMISIWTSGVAEIPFQWIRQRSHFEDEGKRLEFRDRLNRIPGVDIPANAIGGRPTFPLSVLADPSALRQLFQTLEWYMDDLRTALGSK